MSRASCSLCAAGVLLVVLLAAGCNGQDHPAATPGPSGFETRFASYKPAPEPNGDLENVVWPDYVLEAGSDVKQLYEFQVTHGELMRYIPCFCGCGQFAGHRNNRDCYVRRVNPDGSVIFDSMAPT